MPNDMSRVLEDSARGGFFLTIGSITSTVVSALSLFIVGRILGPELYGLYTISMVIPLLLVLFVNPGMSEGIIKFSTSLQLKGEKNKLGTLLLHSLFLKMVLASIAFLVCFIFSEQLASSIFNRPEISGFVQIASLLIIFQAIREVIDSAFIGLDKTEFNAITTSIQAITKAIISVVLVILGLAIIGALIGYVLGYIIACLLGIYFFIVKIHIPLDNSNARGDFSNNLKMLISYGFPLYVSVLIVNFTIQYQYVLLALFTSNLEIGNFRAAANFEIIVISLSVPFALTLLPAFSKIEKRKKAVKKFFKLSVKYSTMAVLPIIVMLMIYAEEIIQITYGKSYELAPAFLSLYVISYLFAGLGSMVFWSFFNGLGETKINLRIILTTSIIQIVLATVLTWLLKANGMILTLILSSLIGTLYSLYTAKKLFEIEIDAKIIMRIYIASLVSAVPLFFIKEVPLYSNLIKVLLAAAIYVVIYLLIIPITKIITLTEIEEMKKIMEKIKPLKYLAQPILCYEEKILRKIS